MARYSASNLMNEGSLQAVGSGFKSLLTLAASDETSERRIEVYDVTFGTVGTPADQVMTWDISRISALGTATAITPLPLDEADAAFLGEAEANATVEPTVSDAGLYATGVNQRATLRWVAHPEMTLISPATDGAGFAFRVKSPGYTGNASVAVLFMEH